MNSAGLPEWSTFAAQCSGARRLLVGFSGGVDSTVLLDLARQWSNSNSLPLLALHVNHQLSPNALQWQQHCENLCAQWRVPIIVETVNVTPSGSGLEAAARAARYEAYSKHVQPGDILLLGHHRDDQVETVLMRLMRGSGVLGLRGIELSNRWQQIKVVRPLLELSKADLLAYARRQHWTWVEDESNADNEFDRNFLRNEIVPALQQRWPQASAAIERTAYHCAEAQQLLDERAHEDLLVRLNPDGSLRLCDTNLPTLSAPRQRNLLRYWLRGLSLPLPSENQLEQILTTIIPAAKDAMPLVAWPGAEIRRYRNALYAMRPLASVSSNPVALASLCSIDLPSGGQWQVNEAEQGTPAGFRALNAGKLSLRYRQGGECCRLVGRPHRPLKKILQESPLPPWWRDRLPLLYVDETLAVIPGVGACDGFQPQDGEVPCWIHWQPPCLSQHWPHLSTESC